jgi:hypothetical protein
LGRGGGGSIFKVASRPQIWQISEASGICSPQRAQNMDWFFPLTTNEEKESITNKEGKSESFCEVLA